MSRGKFFRNVWVIEKHTILHRIAQQSLISLGEKRGAPDYERFTDNGDMTLHSLFIDMQAANRKAINKELKQRLLL